MRDSTGGRLERTADQKLERIAAGVKSGAISLEESLMAALADPHLGKMLTDPEGLAAMAKGLLPDAQMQSLLRSGGVGGTAGGKRMLGAAGGVGGNDGHPKASSASAAGKKSAGRMRRDRASGS